MGSRSKSRSRSRSRSPAREERRSRSRSRSRSPRGGRGGEGGKQTGTACRWNDRGFGFIKPSDGSEDLFCHVSSITDGNMLREGDQVEFKREYDDRKGKYKAVDVTGGSTEERRPRDDYDRRDSYRRDDRDRYDDRGRDYDRRDDRCDRDRDRYDDRRDRY